MEPKNIDRLFQEKLKDLEMVPNPAVWNKIETSLNQKKKKRAAFIWFRYAGIAAVALLGIFLYNNNEKDTKSKLDFEENIITNSTPIFEEPIEITNESKPIKTTTTQEQIAPSSVVSTSITSKKTHSNIIIQQEIKNAPIVAENNNVKTPSKEKEASPQEVKSIFEQIKEFENEKIAVIKKPKTLVNEKKLDIADVLEEKTEETLKSGTWVIAPTVSQLFSNTLSNKSSIDAKLNDATKKGNNSTSFGFKIAYRASNKWQFQTGIHKLELAQTTQDIQLASTVNASSISNSAFDSEVSKALTSDTSFSPDNGLELKNQEEANINQTYGYIEIPMEAKYELLKSKKLEFHLVGGLSTLFLTKNNLQVDSNTFSYSAGEANNLNKINFTLNFGSNLEYHVNQKWYFDIAPMIKFQTNTFDTRSNKPYFFGIYTGFNYKF